MSIDWDSWRMNRNLIVAAKVVGLVCAAIFTVVTTLVICAWMLFGTVTEMDRQLRGQEVSQL